MFAIPTCPRVFVLRSHLVPFNSPRDPLPYSASSGEWLPLWATVNSPLNWRSLVGSLGFTADFPLDALQLYFYYLEEVGTCISSYWWVPYCSQMLRSDQRLATSCSKFQTEGLSFPSSVSLFSILVLVWLEMEVSRDSGFFFFFF